MYERKTKDCARSSTFQHKSCHLCLLLWCWFCPGVQVHKGITIVLSLFRSHWLAVVYCLVLWSVSCVPVHEDRTLIFAGLHNQSPILTTVWSTKLTESWSQLNVNWTFEWLTENQTVNPRSCHWWELQLLKMKRSGCPDHQERCRR